MTFFFHWLHLILSYSDIYDQPASICFLLSFFINLSLRLTTPCHSHHLLKTPFLSVGLLKLIFVTLLPVVSHHLSLFFSYEICLSHFFLFSFFSFYKLQYSSRCLLSSTKQEEKHLLSVLFSNACSLHHWSI